MSLADLAEYSGVRRDRLEHMVETGKLVPVVRGNRGRGCGHQFSKQQAEALKEIERLKKVLRGSK